MYTGVHISAQAGSLVRGYVHDYSNTLNQDACMFTPLRSISAAMSMHMNQVYPLTRFC